MIFGICVIKWKCQKNTKIKILISITGLPQGSRGRGLILSLYWLLEVAPKSVLQPQHPTGRGEF
eukprot:COSAG02_NODE_312_length_24941_cov_60.672611_1_plen_64_part_00